MVIHRHHPPTGIPLRLRYTFRHPCTSRLHPNHRPTDSLGTRARTYRLRSHRCHNVRLRRQRSSCPHCPPRRSPLLRDVRQHRQRGSCPHYTMFPGGQEAARPPGVDPRAADGDGRRIPVASIPHHTLIFLARASAPYSLVLVTEISRMRAGPMVRTTFWSSKLSTPRSHLHWFCIVAILPSRSFTQAGPWIIATQPVRNAPPQRDLGF